MLSNEVDGPRDQGVQRTIHPAALDPLFAAFRSLLGQILSGRAVAFLLPEDFSGPEAAMVFDHLHALRFICSHCWCLGQHSAEQHSIVARVG